MSLVWYGQKIIRIEKGLGLVVFNITDVISSKDICESQLAKVSHIYILQNLCWELNRSEDPSTK